MITEALHISTRSGQNSITFPLGYIKEILVGYFRAIYMDLTRPFFDVNG